MIDVIEAENGDLILTAEPDEIEYLRDRYESGGYWAALCEGLESYSCNGSFTPFDAGRGSPFVGLTDAPCIAESMIWHDDGAQEIDGRFWYHADYVLTCAVERLLNGESVRFTLAC
jgi:hypothetical protein